jgi:hypothetical protein
VNQQCSRHWSDKLAARQQAQQMTLLSFVAQQPQAHLTAR